MTSGAKRSLSRRSDCDDETTSQRNDEKALFGDLINSNGHITITKRKLAGILKLSYKTIMRRTNKGRKMLCYPLDNTYPPFLVGTSSTDKTDKYIIFNYTGWDGDYPNGDLILYIGDVGDIMAEITSIKYKYNFWHINNTKLTLDYPILSNFKYRAITIDPQNCYDMDDALSYNFCDNLYHVGIHITDVSKYIKPNDEIDIIAKQRVESLYTDEQIHMLPLKCVNVLTLKEHNIKNCVNIIVVFNDQFKIVNYYIDRQPVLIDNNYNYEYADNLLEHQHVMLLRLQQIAQYLINDYVEDTHKIIEVYMLLANVIFANELYKNNKPLMRTCDIKPNVPKELKQFKYNRATYCLEPAIHNNIFLNVNNLNCKYYTHMTSPMRRYVDILTHRLMFGEAELSDIDITYINNMSNKYKKAHNEYNYIKTLYKLDKTDGIYSAYIIKLKETTIKLYIKDLDLVCRVQLSNISKLTTPNIKDNCLYYKLDDIEYSYTLYSNVNVHVVICFKTIDKIFINII